jgi:hypothetical protein
MGLSIVTRKKSSKRYHQKRTTKGSLNVKEGKGRFINRPTRTGGKTYDKFFVYVPTEVARDGTFPFKAGEEVHIKIENSKLIVEKATPK